MLKKISELEPQKVFCSFEEITKIPRGSGNTKMIADFLVEFAKKLNLEHYTDEIGNVLIKKEASKGYEKSDIVILQSHMDMVCDKSSQCKKNMKIEGVDAFIEGDFIKADGTSLGADNGAGMALMMALLDDDTISHPKLECVFTTEEETGLYGAEAFDGSMLDGKIMINVDSDSEDVLTVSCAGGSSCICELPITRQSFDGSKVKISISGLAGGHSGEDINLERSNSYILMGRVLEAIQKENDIRIIGFTGGIADNVIPNAAYFYCVVENIDITKNVISGIKKILKSEMCDDDINLEIEVGEDNCTNYVSTETKEEIDISKINPMDKASTRKIIDFLMVTPQGIHAMSKKFKGLVQTSLNLGVLESQKDIVKCVYCLRSSIDLQREYLESKLKKVIELFDGKTEFYGSYPGWEYKEKSKIRDLFTDVYEETHGRKPRIDIIHAGLECGVFAEKIKDLDAVSIGPNIFGLHTYNEKLSVSSTKHVWEMLVEVLKRI